MPCRLVGSVVNGRQLINQLNSLTVNDHSHILEKAVDNLERVKGRITQLSYQRLVPARVDR